MEAAEEMARPDEGEVLLRDLVPALSKRVLHHGANACCSRCRPMPHSEDYIHVPHLPIAHVLNIHFALSRFGKLESLTWQPRVTRQTVWRSGPVTERAGGRVGVACDLAARL